MDISELVESLGRLVVEVRLPVEVGGPGSGVRATQWLRGESVATLASLGRRCVPLVASNGVRSLSSGHLLLLLFRAHERAEEVLTLYGLGRERLGKLHRGRRLLHQTLVVPEVEATCLHEDIELLRLRGSNIEVRLEASAKLKGRAGVVGRSNVGQNGMREVALSGRCPCLVTSKSGPLPCVLLSEVKRLVDGRLLRGWLPAATFLDCAGLEWLRLEHRIGLCCKLFESGDP